MMPDKEEQAPFLTFARFRLYLRVQTFMVLPPYKGAVFRGAFGSSLRRLVCMTRQSDCKPCLLRERCLYVSLFEPPPPLGYAEARKFQQAPRPYILNPPLTPRQAFHPGETLDFELVLIGPAIEALPYFIHIFIEMGRRGLGPERGRYDLRQVDLLRDNGALLVYDGARRGLNIFDPTWGPGDCLDDQGLTALRLDLITPLRIKEKGDLVTKITFPLFFERLAQRLQLLTAFYGNGARFPGFVPLQAQAINITTQENNLHWYDWERYSRRQDAAMKLGGLMGMISFRGDLGLFLPYLRLGENINLGQGTTFGLGKFRIHPREETHVGP